MSALATSSDLNKRHQAASRRERTLVLSAIVPGGLYVIQHLLRKGQPLPGLTPRADELVLYVLGAWAAILIFGFGRGLWKKYGLNCPQCNREFRGTAFEFVEAQGACPSCGTQVLSDVVSSNIHSAAEYVFRYPRFRAIFFLICGVGVAAMGLMVVLGFGSILLTSPFSAKRTIGCLLLILLGLAFLTLATVVGRGWRSLLTEYVVDANGVTARYRGVSTFHKWSDLDVARYASLTRQLELRFLGGSTPIVLTNVELDPDETNLSIVKNLVESCGHMPIKRVLL